MNELQLILTALIGSLAAAAILASIGYRLQSRFVADVIITTALQVKELLLKQAFTRDLIPIDVTLTLFYRIHAAGNPAPISKDTIKATQTVDDWRAATERQALFILRDVTATYDFDKLFQPTDETGVPLRSIEREVRDRLRSVAEYWGVEVAGIQLGAIEIPESIGKQLVENKRAQHEQEAELIKAESDRRIDITRAETAKLVKVTEATARMQTIQAIAHGLKQVLGEDARPEDLIALRFIEYLENRAEPVVGTGEDDLETLLKLQSQEVPRLKSR